MEERTLIDEARLCRSLAEQLANKPEEIASLRIANEFERMVWTKLRRASPSHDLADYYSSREREELRAAVCSEQPGAREVHLVLARTYGRRTHSLVARTA